MNLITYSNFPVRAIAIPYSPDGSRRCAPLTDLHIFQHRDIPATERTEIRFGYDDTKLYMDVTCFQKDGAIQTQNKKSGLDVWYKGGDLLEVVFGANPPNPWQKQFAFNAGGGTFSSCGPKGVTSKVTCFAKKWTAQVQFDLTLLPTQDMALRFGLVRYDKSHQETDVWGNMQTTFNDVEDYGELLFNDYNDAFFMRAGTRPVPSITSRSDYESRLTPLLIPARRVIHGPWTSTPSNDGITISFGTAGLSGAFVEYHPVNSKSGKWTRCAARRINGVLSCEHSFHSVHLNHLKPNTEYEYRVVTLFNEYGPKSVTPVQRFTTPGADTHAFSFAFFSDLHSNSCWLSETLQSPSLRDCDFLVCGGDNLSACNGPQSMYEGLLDILSASGKPTVFVRGNHEQRGLFTETSDRMTASPTGKTYYSFTYADTLFIILDAGNDHPDDAAYIHDNTTFRAEQSRWLKALKKTIAFQKAAHKIVFIHEPPQDLFSHDARSAASLLALLADTTIDLVISGHLHKFATIKPNSGKCVYDQNARPTENTPVFPFPIIINSTDTMVHVTVSKHGVKWKA